MKIQDTTAYMADGVAVVRIPPREELLFFAGTVGARVLLTNAVTTAVVEGIGGDPSDLRLVNNIVAGRWATNDLTQSGRHVGVCPGPTQRVLTDQLDGIADVRSDPKRSAWPRPRVQRHQHGRPLRGGHARHAGRG
jgi:hypothetical protein